MRDAQTAKRVFLYHVRRLHRAGRSTPIPEMLDKMGRSTIDKSRIGGPHQQSNNFGGFVAYTLMPVIALFVTYIRDIRAWLLLPYFLLAAEGTDHDVLPRRLPRDGPRRPDGRLLARAAASSRSGAAIALCFFLVFPSALPESVLVRLESITEQQSVDVRTGRARQELAAPAGPVAGGGAR